MRYSGTWLRPEDEAMLEHLEAHGPSSLDELASNDRIEFSESYIDQRCSKLAGRARLVYFDHGVFRLTDNGERYLEGELDPSVLEPG